MVFFFSSLLNPGKIEVRASETKESKMEDKERKEKSISNVQESARK